MLPTKFILPLLLFAAQVACAQDCQFTNDTMSLQGIGPAATGKYIETTLKNRSQVRFFRTDDGRIFLRLIVTENFYFGKVAMLEIRSGSKSYWVKNAMQYKVDKTHGLFITEIFRNYVGTLRNFGITGIEFGGAYTDFTRSDAAQVKEIAACMYNYPTQEK